MGGIGGIFNLYFILNLLTVKCSLPVLIYVLTYHTSAKIALE